MAAVLQRFVVLLAATLIAACATTERPAPRPLPLDVPGAQRIELPDVLGTPVVVVPPELQTGSLAAGQPARFDITFSIDLRGQVIESSMQASTHPQLDSLMLGQHRKWVYAVATRDNPCAMRRFRGVQTIDVVLKEGSPSAALAPARVSEILRTRTERKLGDDDGLKVPKYHASMSQVIYPRAALSARVEARLALVVEFDAGGAVQDVFPVNAAYDRWGFANAAMRAARLMKAEPAPGRPVSACVPVDFLIR